METLRQKILDLARKNWPVDGNTGELLLVEPVTFALFLLENLSEIDFDLLEVFQREVGEEAALDWSEAVMRDIDAAIRRPLKKVQNA